MANMATAMPISVLPSLPLCRRGVLTSSHTAGKPSANNHCITKSTNLGDLNATLSTQYLLAPPSNGYSSNSHEYGEKEGSTSPSIESSLTTTPFNSPRAPPMHEALILLDWDDTLFPTEELTSIMQHMDSNGQIMVSDSQIASFRKLARLTLSLLRGLIGKYGASHVHVVTNSKRGWIASSLQYGARIASEYQQVAALLATHNINMRSARSTYETGESGSTPTLWKRLCFDVLLQASSGGYRNVITIGDQWSDHMSAKHSIRRAYRDHQGWSRPLHHIIKLKGSPRLADMVNEILYVQTCFEQLLCGATEAVVVDYHREEMNHYLNSLKACK